MAPATRLCGPMASRSFRERIAELSFIKAVQPAEPKAKFYAVFFSQCACENIPQHRKGFRLTVSRRSHEKDDDEACWKRLYTACLEHTKGGCDKPRPAVPSAFAVLLAPTPPAVTDYKAECERLEAELKEAHEQARMLRLQLSRASAVRVRHQAEMDCEWEARDQKVRGEPHLLIPALVY